MTGKEKKKLGGAYPGNRRPQQAPYAPPQSQFQKVDGNTSQATAHFVAYGGGNALVLVDDANSPPQVASGSPAKEYISGKSRFLSVVILRQVRCTDNNTRFWSGTDSHIARGSESWRHNSCTVT